MPSLSESQGGGLKHLAVPALSCGGILLGELTEVMFRHRTAVPARLFLAVSYQAAESDWLSRASYLGQLTQSRLLRIEPGSYPGNIRRSWEKISGDVRGNKVNPEHRCKN